MDENLLLPIDVAKFPMPNLSRPSKPTHWKHRNKAVLFRERRLPFRNIPRFVLWFPPTILSLLFGRFSIAIASILRYKNEFRGKKKTRILHGVSAHIFRLFSQTFQPMQNRFEDMRKCKKLFIETCACAKLSVER